MLHYVLTGDRKAWEVAAENGEGAFNRHGTGGLKDADIVRCAQKETRHETWTMLNLINLYRVNGDPEYLKVANNIAKNWLLTREQVAGERVTLGMVRYFRLERLLETESHPWVIEVAQESLTSLLGGDPPSPPVNLRVVQMAITES